MICNFSPDTDAPTYLEDGQINVMTDDQVCLMCSISMDSISNASTIEIEDQGERFEIWELPMYQETDLALLELPRDKNKDEEDSSALP